MNQFPPSELILNPDGSIYHLNLRPNQVAPIVITVGDQDRVAQVSKYFDHIETQVSKREFVTHTGELNGKRISVISTGIGTDNIDIVLNELDALVNIDLEKRTEKLEKTSLQIIRIGTSGTLQQDIPVDSILVSEFGIGLDGLLHYYNYQNSADEHMMFLNFMEQVGSKTNFPIRPYLFQAAPKLITSLTDNLLKGVTITCPGFYAPQGRSLRLTPSLSELLDQLADFSYKNYRCTNFEMETAGIYGLSNALGHQAISFNAILANRVTKKFSTNPAKTIDDLIQLVLERICNL